MRENAVFGSNLNSGLNVSYLFDLYIYTKTAAATGHQQAQGTYGQYNLPRPDNNKTTCHTDTALCNVRRCVAVRRLPPSPGVPRSPARTHPPRSHVHTRCCALTHARPTHPQASLPGTMDLPAAVAAWQLSCWARLCDRAALPLAAARFRVTPSTP